MIAMHEAIGRAQRIIDFGLCRSTRVGWMTVRGYVSKVVTRMQRGLEVSECVDERRMRLALCERKVKIRPMLRGMAVQRRL